MKKLKVNPTTMYDGSRDPSYFNARYLEIVFFVMLFGILYAVR